MEKTTQMLSYNASTHQFICQGEWNIQHVSLIKDQIQNLNIRSIDKNDQITINGRSVTKMDSAGVWLLIKLKKKIEKIRKKNTQVDFQDFSSQHQTLIQLVEKNFQKETVLKNENEKEKQEKKKTFWLAKFGQYSIRLCNEFVLYLNFVGEISIEALKVLRQPHRIRWQALSGIIYKTGLQGLPIIGLLSFMIGVVLTYQMGLQLKNYGANIYIVDLLGLSVLREFGPLITAIIVAGRTGSAFTAQLGIMKMNQEIDALNTMGVTPVELLLLPRILGLFIALPLLTMWADIFGVIGGMVLSNSMLNITWYDFLQRFPQVIPLRALLIGIGKAPVFALLIASIGCFQGMQVTGSAESVGKNTTRSVVLAIFFIIVADAFFSVLFSKLKL